MFDFVIVGAGSAGCVLARRLSDDTGVRVLLLEAGGPDRRREIHIPAAFSKLFKSECDWAYFTESQPHLNHRRLYWPRGKTLGGSSSINAMVYIRGHRLDFNSWGASGNRGWSYAELLPYFKKAQNQERGASEFHAQGGPLNVADQRSINPLSRAFVEAAVESGFERNSDFNGAEQDGFGFYQVNQKKGRRCSAAAAYLKPALGRRNLEVRTGAHVTRLICAGGRAAGVEYVWNGRADRVEATHEVLLCGGTVNSPQVLLLSGIGPAAELSKLGIPVVLDLPGVGRNMHDHMFLPVAHECRKPISLAGAESFASLLRFFLLDGGPLTSNIAEAGGFVRTRSALPAPDLQFHFGPVYYLDHGFTRPKGHGFTLGPTLIRPLSRGSIALRSAEPFAPPLIQPNYLAEPADLEVLCEGVRLARRILRGRALDPFRGAESYPGPAVQSDDEIRDYVRRTAETIYHPAGTCRMGSGATAVVDDQLRVHGLERLRVVDAAVMPTVIGGNTNAAVIMIAEKAADMILGHR